MTDNKDYNDYVINEYKKFSEPVNKGRKGDYKFQRHFNDIPSAITYCISAICIDYFWNPENLKKLFCKIDEWIKNEEWQKINDFINQYLKLKSIPCDCSTEYDNSFYGDNLIWAYACGDENFIETYFPKKYGLTKNGYRAYVVCCNLIMAKYYEDENMLKAAIGDAEKFVNTKAPKWQISLNKFLLALLNHDISPASEELNNFCKLSKRLSSDYPLEEKFALFTHGLYMIASKWLDEDEFAELKMPDNKRFIREYALWRIKNKTPEKKYIYTYPEETDILNIILQQELPEMLLKSRTENGYTKRYEDYEERYNKFVKQIKSAYP